MIENLSVALQKHIFTTHGRLNRLRYIKYQILFALGIAIVSAILGFVVGLIFGEESFFLDILTLGMSLVGLAGSAAIVIRRLHDLDRPEWWVIGVLIPIIGFIFALYLLFIPGTVGRNKYGEDPLR